MPFARRAVSFVSEVVGRPRKGIDGGDVRAGVARQQPRRDRKIFIVAVGIGDAGSIGLIDCGLYHSTSGIPAR